MTTRHADDPALAAFGRTLAAIARSDFNLRDVLQSVVEEAARLCRADVADIAVGDGAIFRVSAFTGFSAEYEELVSGLVHQPGGGSVIDRALRDAQVVHIEDVLADPEFAVPEVQRAGDFRTDLGVPIWYGDEVIGVIGAARHEVRPFSEREIGLVEQFADQAAIAIVLARLFATVERQRTEPREIRTAGRRAPVLGGGRAAARRPSTRDHRAVRDLRGFTAFAERPKPEEVLGVLREYHATVGELMVASGGTLEHFAGDGLMVFFNDPSPGRSRRAAVRSRARCEIGSRSCPRLAQARLRAGIRDRDRVGYATIGRIGFEGRYDYGAVGMSVILASRLSSAARPMRS